MMDEADLHIHTYYSDGTFSPEEAVEYAKGVSLRAMAITDHDTVGGIAEAVAAGDKLGVEVIPGVEITTIYKGMELHILGYYIDTKAAALAALLGHPHAPPARTAPTFRLRLLHGAPGLTDLLLDPAAILGDIVQDRGDERRRTSRSLRLAPCRSDGENERRNSLT